MILGSKRLCQVGINSKFLLEQHMQARVSTSTWSTWRRLSNYKPGNDKKVFRMITRTNLKARLVAMTGLLTIGLNRPKLIQQQSMIFQCHTQLLRPNKLHFKFHKSCGCLPIFSLYWGAHVSQTGALSSMMSWVKVSLQHFKSTLFLKKKIQLLVILVKLYWCK